ncbi:2039_t:CDS:2, partial [Cetraspora pellucida]
AVTSEEIGLKNYLTKDEISTHLVLAPKLGTLEISTHLVLAPKL